jgi:hypothetical protein
MISDDVLVLVQLYPPGIELCRVLNTEKEAEERDGGDGGATNGRGSPVGTGTFGRASSDDIHPSILPCNSTNHVRHGVSDRQAGAPATAPAWQSWDQFRLQFIDPTANAGTVSYCLHSAPRVRHCGVRRAGTSELSQSRHIPSLYAMHSHLLNLPTEFLVCILSRTRGAAGVNCHK